MLKLIKANQKNFLSKLDFILQKRKLQNPKIEKQVKNIIQDNKFEDVTKVLNHLIYLSYSTGIFLGVDMDKAFNIVHESNMSKLCISEEEANESVKWYEDEQDVYDSPTYKKSKNEKYWIVYNRSTGKIF